MGKYYFDLIVSTFFVIFFIPILIIVCVLVWIDLGYPIFFLQERIGLKGKSFKLIKFRTMVTPHVTEETEPLADECRVTRLGRILRSLSLDELPALINVIKGDMSLIGPRPLLPEYMMHYNDEQRRRHDVKPGLTGWAQINGRNLISWEEKFRFDTWYVDNQSFFLDLKILLITIIKVFSREGINDSNGRSMPLFRGNKKK